MNENNNLNPQPTMQPTQPTIVQPQLTENVVQTAPQPVQTPVPQVPPVPQPIQPIQPVQPQPHQKSNTAYIVIIAVMALIIVGLSGYIVYDKFISPTTLPLQEEVEEEEEKEPEIPTRTTMSSDWKDGEFTMGGVIYKLNTNYAELKANGWIVNFVEEGFGETYILNKGDKTFSTVDIKNTKYSDSQVTVGFINLSETAVDISKSQYWAINVDNSFSDTPVDFALPGGLKNGSALVEVETAYGKPETTNIYRAETLKYTVYTYEYENSVKLRLTIYDEGGLTGFSYQII